MKQLTIVKIGGNIIDDAGRLSDFLRLFAALEGPAILVHGGGKIATALGRRLGIAPQYVQGRRITDAATLELVTMVYGGLVNKQLVAGLQGLGCPALGLTGADGAVLRARKRPVQHTDFGFVGDLDASGVNTGRLQLFLDAGLRPVMAPLTFDGSGSLLNTNADTIAAALACAFAPGCAVRLVYCFEHKGVLASAADPQSLIPQISAAEYAQLKDSGIVTEGMIPKLDNAFDALRQGVAEVIIGHALELPSLLNHQTGTILT
jgi:acetylglutamate kinase